ncbi:hypothetical protein OG943_38990 [Amycolatopsis sp. NBC_00345]|uniref:hypothetical protein n=1 Tax=Amycolatopsis sp. NBC_00345 TaxID=2975955 RepID=UPI002E2583D0
MMPSQKFEDTVRQELAATPLPATQPDESAQMARAVLATRARRRRRGVVAAAVTAVAVAAGGSAVIGTVNGSGAPAQVQTAAVTQWPARGPLSGDTGLAQRARQVWSQAAPDAVSSGLPAALLYAGATPAGSAVAETVVVLRGQDHDGGTRLAFLTGSDQQHLQVRAQLEVPDGQLGAPAYGFVGTQPRTGGTTAPVSLAVAITAPGVTSAWFTTSAVDAEMSDSVSRPADGLLTTALPPAAAAWNTRIATGGPKNPAFGTLTGTTVDPVTSPGVLTGGGARLQGSTGAARGDIVTTTAGFAGVVTAVSATGEAVVDADLAQLPVASGLRVVTAVTGHPVTLSATGGQATVTAGPEVLREGNRIVLTGFGISAGEVNLGTVHPGPGGTWLLQRTTRPADGPAALIHR